MQRQIVVQFIGAKENRATMYMQNWFKQILAFWSFSAFLLLNNS